MANEIMEAANDDESCPTADFSSSIEFEQIDELEQRFHGFGRLF
jgi:hypothetical protein